MHLVMSYLALSSANPCRDFLAALQALRVELSQLGKHVQMWDGTQFGRNGAGSFSYSFHLRSESVSNIMGLPGEMTSMDQCELTGAWVC
jgi:hypothetical protein